jgi:hypothetical protein
MNRQREELEDLISFYQKLATDTHRNLSSKQERLRVLQLADYENEEQRQDDLLDEGVRTFVDTYWDSSNLGEILELERDIDRLTQLLSAQVGELARIREQLDDAVDVLQPLRDAFRGEDMLRPVPVYAFRQKTIDGLEASVEFMKEKVDALPTNYAQDEDADYYFDILPGAIFVLNVMKKLTGADARIPRFDLGINEVISLFDEDEKQLWDELMAGETVLD